MKETNKIPLTTLRDRLQARMHYANPKDAFNVLLYGWAKKNRHGIQWLSAVKKRNWLSAYMVRDFENYCGYKIT